MILVLNPQQTIQLLDHMGLSFLANNGGHFNSLLEMNLSILDPTILANMLPQIKRLIWGNISEVYNHTYIQIELDPNESWKTLFYQNIEVNNNKIKIILWFIYVVD